MMNKRVMSAAAVGFFFLAFSSARADDHGNSPTNSPTALPVGTVRSGVLETPSDVDCFATPVDPGAWYGWALFGDPAMRPFEVFNAEAEYFGSRTDYFDTLIWEEWDHGESRTFYPAVAFSEHYSGDETAYRLAAVRFPTATSPTGSLITFTLSAANPVDTRLFALAEGSGPKVVCMSSLERMGGDADPQLVGRFGSGGLALSANTTARHIEIVGDGDAGTSLRTLVHNPGWDNMSPEGDLIGLRVHAYNPSALTNGTGTGRISAPCQADLWTMNLEEGKIYAAWLTRPDGSLADWGDYEIAPFFDMQDGSTWIVVQPSIQGALSFEAWYGGQYVFAVLSNEAKSEDYTLHVQEFAGDDYGRWPGDTPDVGAVNLNAMTSGNLEVPPDEDAFLFEAKAGKTYALYSPVEDDFAVRMSGDWNWSEYLYGTLITAPEAGTCQVLVSYENACGAYEFQVSEFLDDADNTQADAIRLTVGGAEIANDLKAPGDQDWFVFAVESGQSYTFTAGNVGHTLMFYGDDDWSSRNVAGPQATIEADFTGDYYLVIRGTPTQGVYSAKVELADGGSSDYDLWAAGYDLGSENGPNDDADGDGFTNEQERIAGTNPTLRGDLFRSTTAAFNDAGTGLILGDALAGRIYTVRYASDLLLDSSLWAVAEVTIVNGKIVAAADLADLSAYYRLYVELE